MSIKWNQRFRPSFDTEKKVNPSSHTQWTCTDTTTIMTIKKITNFVFKQFCGYCCIHLASQMYRFRCFVFFLFVTVRLTWRVLLTVCCLPNENFYLSIYLMFFSFWNNNICCFFFASLCKVHAFGLQRVCVCARIWYYLYIFFFMCICFCTIWS